MESFIFWALKVPIAILTNGVALILIAWAFKDMWRN